MTARPTGRCLVFAALLALLHLFVACGGGGGGGAAGGTPAPGGGSQPPVAVTTSAVAITENSATSRVWSWPVPMARATALARAILRDRRTISAIDGIRLAIRSNAIGGDSKAPGAASRVSIQ